MPVDDQRDEELEWLRSKQRIWVVIPYAGEDGARLNRTVESAWSCDPDGVHIEHDKHKSLPRTLNSGFQAARDKGATHIMWVSTGDSVASDRISSALPIPNDRGQFCRTYIQSRELSLPVVPNWEEEIWADNQFCLGGSIVPVRVWRSVGGFNEDLVYCCDWDFAVRVHAHYGWEFCSKRLATANEYEDGLTKSADSKQRQWDRSKVHRWAQGLEKKVRHG